MKDIFLVSMKNVKIIKNKIIKILYNFKIYKINNMAFNKIKNINSIIKIKSRIVLKKSSTLRYLKYSLKILKRLNYKKKVIRK